MQLKWKKLGVNTNLWDDGFQYFAEIKNRQYKISIRLFFCYKDTQKYESFTIDMHTKPYTGIEFFESKDLKVTKFDEAKLLQKALKKLGSFISAQAKKYEKLHKEALSLFEKIEDNELS